MSYSDTKRLGDEFKSAFESFKEVHLELRNEVKNFGECTKETKNKLDRVNDRLDQFETKLSRPKVASSNKLEMTHHEEAFYKFITKGDERELKTTLNETIDPEGGYLVPPEWSNFIIESLVQWSPIRRYARVIKVNSKNFKIPVQQQAQNLQTGAPESGLFETGWTADMGPVNQTNTGQVGLATIPTNDMYALPFVTQDMLEDSVFDIEEFLKENIAKSMAHLEGRAFVLGDGIGKPLGLLQDTSKYSQVTAGVPAPQYSLGDDPNVLIDAYYALPDYYARNGTWIMNRQTIRAVREWTDGNGQYLWTPVYGDTISKEAPALILGRPYAEAIDMPGPTSIVNENPIYAPGSVPIVFGDIRSAYVITDRRGVTMLRDPYSNKPFVLFYTTARVGGQVVLPEALVAVNVNPTP